MASDSFTRFKAIILTPHMFCLLSALLTFSSAFPLHRPKPTHPGHAPHYRTYFYIPGSYVPLPEESDPTLVVQSGQLYVEKLTPLHPRRNTPSLVLLHGSAQTGTNFISTPDGRPGWADFFLNAGYTVYIPDQILMGRSSHPPGANLTWMPAQQIEKFFTDTATHAVWPQARLQTQWPGAGRRGDPIFDNYFAGLMPFEADNIKQIYRMIDAIVHLVNERIDGEAVLIAHSQAGFWLWPAAERLRGKLKAAIALEPPGPPLEDKVVSFDPPPHRPWGLTDTPLTYDPPVTDPLAELVETAVRVGAEKDDRSSCLQQAEPARQLKLLRDLPTLVVTAEASYHDVYDHCTVQWLRQAGVVTDHLELGEEGVRGNGHMFFSEKNNFQSWRLVERWLSRLKMRGKETL